MLISGRRSFRSFVLLVNSDCIINMGERGGGNKQDRGPVSSSEGRVILRRGSQVLRRACAQNSRNGLKNSSVSLSAPI